MADVKVTVLEKLLHNGVAHEVGKELEVAEDLAKSLVERGVAEVEKVGRRGSKSAD